jgi:hypothetical protein
MQNETICIFVHSVLCLPPSPLYIVEKKVWANCLSLYLVYNIVTFAHGYSTYKSILRDTRRFYNIIFMYSESNSEPSPTHSLPPYQSLFIRIIHCYILQHMYVHCIIRITFLTAKTKCNLPQHNFEIQIVFLKSETESLMASK